MRHDNVVFFSAREVRPEWRRSPRRRRKKLKFLAVVVVTASAAAGSLILLDRHSGPGSALDTPDYLITDIELTVDENSVTKNRWVLSFTASWIGDGNPERSRCSYEIRDAAGRLTYKDSMTLRLGSEHRTHVATHVILPPDLQQESVMAAVRCV